VWPIISPPEDYVEAAEFFANTIKKHSRIITKTLLNLGCGGGHEDNTLKKYFDITGVDINKEILALAKNLNLEVIYHQGDMRSIRLGELFDAAIITDAINAMTTKEDLHRAFITAYEHLKPGGVFLTFAEIIVGKFKQNKTLCSTHSKGNLEIAFIQNYYDPNSIDTSYEATFVFLIRKEGELEVQIDHALCGIFELETWLNLLKEVGFEVEQRKLELSTMSEGESIPVLVCHKPLK
jgi:SAM-dependent methyltransferase